MGRTPQHIQDRTEWERQGLIGKSLQFTDDEIVSTLGIGKSKTLQELMCDGYGIDVHTDVLRS